MEGKEMIATKGNQKIIQRYFEDGTRFIKHIPFNPQIIGALKAQFSVNPNVEVKLGQTGWIMVKKVGKDTKLEEAAKKVIDANQEIHSYKDIIEKEASLMKKGGFVVIVRDLNG